MIIGIDPDLHCVSMAAIDLDQKILLLQSIKIHKDLKGYGTLEYFMNAFNRTAPQALEYTPTVVIEGQNIIQSRNTKIRKQDIVILANMAGAIYGAWGAIGAKPHIVLPFDWKGSVKKEVHQRRTCLNLGWKYNNHPGYVSPIIPKDWEVISNIYIKGENKEKLPNQGDWKHIMDSIGLALWGMKNIGGK